MGPSRIIIPYVRGGLQVSTEVWGERNSAEFYDLTGWPEGYFHLLARLWHDGEAFMVVEQDITPPDNAVEGIALCQEPWCGHPYQYQPTNPELDMLLFGELGLTRFSQALLCSLPYAVLESEELVLEAPFSNEAPRHFMRLARRLRLQLQGRGVRFHPHSPVAKHYRPSPQGGGRWFESGADTAVRGG